MKPDLFLNRSAIYVFIIFFLFALWAFWPGYFSPLIESKEVAIKYHTHGLGMMMWCMMLISQALLIRINKNSIHRLIGKFSYLLVPYIFFSTLDLVHSLMAEVTTWRAIDLLTWPSWSMQLFFLSFYLPWRSIIENIQVCMPGIWYQLFFLCLRRSQIGSSIIILSPYWLWCRSWRVYPWCLQPDFCWQISFCFAW